MSVVVELEPPSVVLLPVELVDVVDEPPPVDELASPELVSTGRVDAPGVVKPVVAAPGSPHAVSPARVAAKATR